MTTITAAELPQLLSPEQREYKTILVYGPTGAGKSWFGVSDEKAKPTLVLMTEDASGLEGYDVKIAHTRTSGQVWAVLRALQSKTPPYDQFEGGILVWDSLTQLEGFLDAVDAEEEARRGNSKTALLIGGDSYRRVQEDIRRMIWAGRALPMHQVYICLERTFVNKDDFISMRGPDLTPSLSGDVRSYCDVVAYMTAEKMDVKKQGGETEKRLVRRLWLQPGDGFHARVRAGKGVVVSEVVNSPTLPKLFAVLKGDSAK